jgi:lipopolysaccharide/colanic/teichoic acid biosynthesis glycosyltransferase
MEFNTSIAPMRKRLLDVALSLFMMALSLPVLLPIALAVRLEDGGPVLFRQERWGQGGRIFRLTKFRTMAPNGFEVRTVCPATVNDARVTRVGRILRAMGLDELPQLVNIFSGDMSFVGPRALAVGEMGTDAQGRTAPLRDLPGFRERAIVLPGLTGPATIYLSKDAPAVQKFQVDLRYIRNWSLTEDLRLIGLSFWISLRGKWESREQKF